ncbi:hypothetical protein BpHYR1_046833 [Brachionus plicatilis]|uniref:Uncharacterized protein n=1 Tax=Brachionus plicatilis TaxID=10195 RepID=A0A3M7S085_BRAPC|nr:hypothetical protein BpHYR1_046833 [Brachionus plicatilis]
MRQRHNIGAFLPIVENDIIGRWSRDRHPDNVNLCLINIFVSRNSYFVTTNSFFCHRLKLSLVELVRLRKKSQVKSVEDSFCYRKIMLIALTLEIK